MMIINLTLHCIKFQAKGNFSFFLFTSTEDFRQNKQLFKRKGEAFLKLHFFLRLRISWNWGHSIVMVCWTTKLWKIRQTTQPSIAIIGNKPAVTFNCIILISSLSRTDSLFSISQSCFYPRLLHVYLSLALRLCGGKRKKNQAQKKKMRKI